MVYRAVFAGVQPLRHYLPLIALLGMPIPHALFYLEQGMKSLPDPSCPQAPVMAQEIVARHNGWSGLATYLLPSSRLNFSRKKVARSVVHIPQRATPLNHPPT